MHGHFSNSNCLYFEEHCFSGVGVITLSVIRVEAFFVCI